MIKLILLRVSHSDVGMQGRQGQGSTMAARNGKAGGKGGAERGSRRTFLSVSLAHEVRELLVG